MKLMEIYGSERHAEQEWRTGVEAPKGEYWLIDRASGRKLAGPFKDQERALSFKKNRKDRIPADAVAKPL